MSNSKMSRDMEEVCEIINRWRRQRYILAGPFTTDGLREFVAFQNECSRKLISIFRSADPEFWSSLVELSTMAQTLTTPNAKVFANGIDRTNV